MRIRAVTLTALVVASVVSSLTFLLPQNAAAAAPIDQASCQAQGGTWINNDRVIGVCDGAILALGFSLEDQVKSYVYYRELGTCLVNGGPNLKDGWGWDGGQRINQVHAVSGDWFGQNGAPGGGSLKGIGGLKVKDYAVGSIDCAQTPLVTDALKLWGNWAPDEALCAMGMRRASDAEFNANRCTDSQGGTDEFKRGDNMLNAYRNAIKNRVYGGKTPAVTANPAWADAGKYLLYLRTFQAICVPSATLSTFAPTGSTDRDYHLRIPSRGDGSPTGGPSKITYTTMYYTSLQNKAQGDAVITVAGPTLDIYGLNAENTTCGAMMKAINGDDGKNNGLADKYGAWLLQDPKEKDAANPATSPGAPSVDNGKSSCPVDGIGWIVCPVLNAVGGLDDAMWGLTSSLLTVSPLQQYQTDDAGAVVKDRLGNPTPTTAYAMWKALWSVTNVGFAIIFLVIIFAQLSGVGIGNYGVKKMLPRFVIAVLLAALSFSLVQIAVDLSNVFGKSIYDLMDGITNKNTPPATWSGGTESLITVIIAGGLTGVGIATIGAGTALMFILPGALAVFLGFLAALLTLIFRQALIPILAVVAPLAILAYVLPNTEKWFEKWRGMFLTMLMLFPLAALLFGGVKMAAYMINSAGTPWSKLIALIVMGVPLFMLPFIARQAGPMLSKIQDAAKGLGDRFQKPVKSWAGKQGALGLARADASKAGRFNVGRRIRQAVIRSGRRRDLRTSAWGAESDATFNSDLATNATKLATEFPEDGAGAAHIRAVAARAQGEEVKLAMDSMKLEAGFNPNDRNALAKALAHAIEQGDQTRATGLTNYLVAARGVDELHSTLVGAQAAGHMDAGMSTALQRAMTSSENGGVIKERRLDLTTWGAKGGAIDAVSKDAKTWSVSAEDASGLSLGAMRAALATGGMPAEIAQRVLETPQLRGRLDTNKEAVMSQIAGRLSTSAPQTRTVGPVGSEVTGQGQTPNGPDELDIPRT